MRVTIAARTATRSGIATACSDMSSRMPLSDHSKVRAASDAAASEASLNANAHVRTTDGKRTTDCCAIASATKILLKSG